MAQQNGSKAHTAAAQSPHAAESGPPSVHTSCGHGQAPQSVEHDEQVSPRPQVPLPQAVSQGSPQIDAASLAHRLSHETLQQNESTAHTSVTQSLQPSSRAAPVTHTSWAQVPPQVPQSDAHEEQVSVAEHTPSPQAPGQTPQSDGQVVHPSVASQVPLPHTAGHTPQSPGQLEQLSPAPQLPSPHTGGQVPPHIACASLTQMASHVPLQQNESDAHTMAAQGSQLSSSAEPVTQGE